MASAGWSDPRRQGCQRPRRSSATPTARSPAAVQQARAASLCHALCLRSSQRPGSCTRRFSALENRADCARQKWPTCGIAMRDQSFERPGQRAKNAYAAALHLTPSARKRRRSAPDAARWPLAAPARPADEWSDSRTSSQPLSRQTARLAAL